MATHAVTMGPQAALDPGGLASRALDPAPAEPAQWSSRARRFIATVAGVGALTAPSVALACPYCATRSGGGIGQSIALGVFLALPFVVAGVIYSILRREAE